MLSSGEMHYKAYDDFNKPFVTEQSVRKSMWHLMEIRHDVHDKLVLIRELFNMRRFTDLYNAIDNLNQTKQKRESHFGR